MENEHKRYGWERVEKRFSHPYLLPVLLRTIGPVKDRPKTILDVGCGNGYISNQLSSLGHKVVGIDASRDGIEVAKSGYPHVTFKVCSIYNENLLEAVGGPVDCVVAVEVVEHLFYPKTLFSQAHKILNKGGRIFVSTPYHGYLKNLAISLINGWDRHFNVDWDGGHIKFFSPKTLKKQAEEAGFKNISISGAGRAPLLWKSMILNAEK